MLRLQSLSSPLTTQNPKLHLNLSPTKRTALKLNPNINTNISTKTSLFVVKCQQRFTSDTSSPNNSSFASQTPPAGWIVASCAKLSKLIGEGKGSKPGRLKRVESRVEEEEEMLRLQSLSSPLTTQNPKLHLNLSPTKRTALKLNPNNNTNISTKTSLFVVKCQQRFTSDTSSPNNSSFASQTPPPAGTFPTRFFVGHSIYKGKAALTIEPRAPEFTPLDVCFVKFLVRNMVLTYYRTLSVFSLSVTEIGSLVCLGKKESCEFFHDPFKGKSEEGKVRKVLKVEPLPDGSGHFFNLSVQNKLLNVDDSIYIPVTRAEYTVLISAFNFILPYLLGWHAFANSIKPEETSLVNSANPRYGGDFEWSR
ncbi:single-stranded DNA-binding protein WHY1, chloroplastic [Quercus suber]|uniref:single-stranded DNA-binding protein WHY1, chloroplastic n=1 Tax=Quercus suber TaxID=58331 RepID=UPI0032DEF8BB